MRSGENALFSFSPNLAGGRNDSLAELGVHRKQGDQAPPNEEPPHDEKYLEEILQRRGLRSSMKCSMRIYEDGDEHYLLHKYKG